MNSGFLLDLTQPYRDLGIDMEADHVPVPIGHSPDLEYVVSTGFEGISLREPGSDVSIHCENPVEVQQ